MHVFIRLTRFWRSRHWKQRCLRGQLRDKSPSLEVRDSPLHLPNSRIDFISRHGQLEDRDPYRLKDRNGDPVLCFKCGNSALPPGVAASAPATKRTRRATSLRNIADSGRGIISCDYCHLHWHLDCVEPPLSFVPPWEKRWMCPNHADHIHVSYKSDNQTASPVLTTLRTRGDAYPAIIHLLMKSIPQGFETMGTLKLLSLKLLLRYLPQQCLWMKC